MNGRWMKSGGGKHNAEFWKFFAILGMLFGAVMTLVSLFFKKKNDEYRDALIELSERFPGEEGTEGRRESWQSAHAPANRKTVEERLAEQRIQEEM